MSISINASCPNWRYFFQIWYPVFLEILNSLHNGAILSPSSNLAINLIFSSNMLHSFHGIRSPPMPKKCNPCLRYEVLPMSQEGHWLLITRSILSPKSEFERIELFLHRQVPTVMFRVGTIVAVSSLSGLNSVSNKRRWTAVESSFNSLQTIQSHFLKTLIIILRQ